MFKYIIDLLLCGSFSSFAMDEAPDWEEIALQCEFGIQEIDMTDDFEEILSTMERNSEAFSADEFVIRLAKRAYPFKDLRRKEWKFVV